MKLHVIQNEDAEHTTAAKGMRSKFKLYMQFQ